MSNLTMVETVPREPLNFVIGPYDNQKEQYTLQAKSLEQKRRWCQAIKKLIIENFHKSIPDRAKQVVLGGDGTEEKDKLRADSWMAAAAAKKQNRRSSTLDTRKHPRRKSFAAFHCTAEDSTPNSVSNEMPGGDGDLHPNDDSNLVLSDPSGARGRCTARLSSVVRKERLRSHSADNISRTCSTLPLLSTTLIGDDDDDVTVETPPLANCNDLKNVLFLAEQDGEDFRSTSCTEDEESTDDMSGSESNVSESCDHDNINDDHHAAPTVVITDRLRQLASSTYILTKPDHDTSVSPVVEAADLPLINVVQDHEERLTEDQVRDVDSGRTETVNGSDSGVLNPPIVDVVQDHEEQIPEEEDSVRVCVSGIEEVAYSNDTGVLSQSDSEFLCKPFSNVVPGEGEGLSEDLVRVDDSENIEMTNTDSASVGVLLGEEPVPELQPFTSQSELPIIVIVQDEEEHLPEDQCEEESVEIIGVGNTETVNNSNDDDAVVLDLAALVSDEPFASQSESRDDIQSSDALENAADKTDTDGTDGGLDTMADLERSFAAFYATLPKDCMKPGSVECERRSSVDDTFITNSVEGFARDDSYDGYAKSLSQASSVCHGSSEEFLAADSQVTIPVMTAAADEELFYTNAELDAVMTSETKDHEVVSEHRGSTDEELWLGHERNYVFRLARAYSTRVKEIKASTSTNPRHRMPRVRQNSTDNVLNKDLPSSWSRRKFELTSMAAEDCARLDVVSRQDSGRSRAKSVDDAVSLPHTSVQETIRKLKLKAESNISHPGISTGMSESFEDSPQQFLGAGASQRSSAARHTSSLVQERVRMLRDGGAEFE